MIRSGNPTMKAFEKPMTWDDLGRETGDGSGGGGPVAAAPAKVMTIGGAVTATGMMLGVCVASAVLAWGWFQGMIEAGNQGGMVMPTMGAMAVGFVLSLVMSFKPGSARIVAMPYAGLQGVFLAGVSIFVGQRYLGGDSGELTGLITQAVMVTFSIAAGMLAAYGSGLVRLGGFAKKMIVTMMMGVAIYYLAAFGLGFMGINIAQPIHSTGPIGIGFTALMVVLASFMLLMDFQYVDEAAKAGNTPKHMEWYAGFAVLSSLVWLYIEVLRLLAKLRSNE